MSEPYGPNVIKTFMAIRHASENTVYIVINIHKLRLQNVYNIGPWFNMAKLGRKLPIDILFR